MASVLLHFVSDLCLLLLFSPSSSWARSWELFLSYLANDPCVFSLSLQSWNVKLGGKVVCLEHRELKAMPVLMETEYLFILNSSFDDDGDGRMKRMQFHFSSSFVSHRHRSHFHERGSLWHSISQQDMGSKVIVETIFQHLMQHHQVVWPNKYLSFHAYSMHIQYKFFFLQHMMMLQCRACLVSGLQYIKYVWHTLLYCRCFEYWYWLLVVWSPDSRDFVSKGNNQK